jgi:hypothetical protein
MEDKDIAKVEQTEKLQPGEKGFAVFLFIFGSFFAYQAYLMYLKKPGPSSYAAVPLFVSILIMIFSALIFITSINKQTVNHNKPIIEKIKATFSYIFQRDVLGMIILIFLYSIALRYKLGFYIVTPIFLWVAMSFLMAKNYLKNILWTLISILFIYVVFTFSFSVVLP